MSILGMCGFEYQNTSDDQLTFIAGTPSYSATVPSDSGSARSLSGSSLNFRRPWFSGDGATLNTPSGTVYWGHFRYQKNANNSGNNAIALGFGRNGTEQITISVENTTLNLTIRVNGAVVKTSATAISLTTWERLHIRVDHQSGGAVTIYKDGNLATPVDSYTLSAGDISTLAGLPNEFWIRTANSSTDRIDDCVAMDPADATGVVSENDLTKISIKPQVVTGNGNYTTWTGDYTAIDELPNNDSDFINATAVDQRESFTKPAIAEDRVLAAQVLARVTRVGTTAGQNMEVFMRAGGVDEDQGSQPAPGDGRICTILQEKRGGGAWTAADWDATEIGFVSRT